jgi:phage gpG-like protein
VATVAEVSARLREMQERAPVAATRAAMAMALTFTTEVKIVELSRTTSSPSPAGSPPALVSGALRDSVRPEPPVIEGPRTAVVVGGTVVYARIHELSGWAGRGHASFLPKRPYIKPAVERLIASGALTRAAVTGWLSAMGG